MMDEGNNPLGANKSTPISNVKYEPLEVEMVDVTADKTTAEPKPWYKSRRFWIGATIVTTAVVGVVSLVYSLTGNDENSTPPNPLLSSPSASPLPSIIASVTGTVTATASAIYASMTRTATDTRSGSRTYTSSRTPTETVSWSPSDSDSITSTCSYWESVSRTVSFTRSLSLTPSNLPVYNIWEAQCIFNSRSPTSVTCTHGSGIVPGCTPRQMDNKGCDPMSGKNSCVMDAIFHRKWLCYPSGYKLHFDYSKFSCNPSLLCN